MRGDALTYVCTLRDQYGERHLADLERVIGDGGVHNISGAALVARARSAASRRARKPAR